MEGIIWVTEHRLYIARPCKDVENEKQSVRFQVITVVSMKMAVFWVVVLCSLVEVY
jgi:hypothetical protein